MPTLIELQDQLKGYKRIAHEKDEELRKVVNGVMLSHLGGSYSNPHWMVQRRGGKLVLCDGQIRVNSQSVLDAVVHIVSELILDHGVLKVRFNHYDGYCGVRSEGIRPPRMYNGEPYILWMALYFADHQL